MSPFFLREGFRAGSLRNVHHFVFSLPFFWSKIEYCSPVTFHRKMKLTKNVGVCTDTAIDVSHWSAGPVVVTASPELTGFSHFPLPTSVLFVRWSFFCSFLGFCRSRCRFGFVFRRRSVPRPRGLAGRSRGRARAKQSMASLINSDSGRNATDFSSFPLA